MLRKIISSILLVLIGLIATSLYAQTKTIHVVVALTDNKYQNIARVPAALGNGQDPRNNLYWGAGYGFKTFFNKQKEWQLISTTKDPEDLILERLVYKHKTQDIYLVADAYDGKYIENTTKDFLKYSAGAESKTIQIAQKGIQVGGSADLVIYVGHDYLMDRPMFWLFPLGLPDISDEQRTIQPARQAAVFACKSQRYFSSVLSKAGISPAILTTGNMAPEAYVVYALIDGWSNNKSKQQIHEQVAQAYSQYQKLSKPARKLFATEYTQ